MSRDQSQELLHGRRGRVRATRLASALGCVGLLAFSAYFSRDSMGGDQVVGNAVAKAGRAKLLALQQCFENHSMIDGGMLACRMRDLLQKLLFVLRLEARQDRLGIDDLG